MEDLQRTCFFCAEKIEEKKSLEHVIPNSLLGQLNIKNEKVIGDFELEYSRVKVPAHKECNNTFGSEYEKSALELLKDTDKLFEAISQNEDSLAISYGPDVDEISIITSWLTKIYYGFFYHDHIKTNNQEWKEICNSVIQHKNFDMMRASYKNSYGFQLPSSLFAFKTCHEGFGFNTLVSPPSIMLTIDNLTLILCICDGYLTKKYADSYSLGKIREWIKGVEEQNDNPPSHLLLLAEIAALTSSIPKSPSFLFDGQSVTNMSFSTMAANPEKVYAINTDRINEARAFFWEALGIKLLPPF